METDASPARIPVVSNGGGRGDGRTFRERIVSSERIRHDERGSRSGDRGIDPRSALNRDFAGEKETGVAMEATRCND